MNIQHVITLIIYLEIAQKYLFQTDFFWHFLPFSYKKILFIQYLIKNTIDREIYICCGYSKSTFDMLHKTHIIYGALTDNEITGGLQWTMMNSQKIPCNAPILSAINPRH